MYAEKFHRLHKSPKACINILKQTFHRFISGIHVRGDSSWVFSIVISIFSVTLMLTRNEHVTIHVEVSR